MKNTFAVQVFAVSLLAVGLPSAGTAAEDRPNVIIILTDDQGFGELGATGNPAHPHAAHRPPGRTGRVADATFTSCRSARPRGPA